MLALATHEPRFRVLREDVFAQDGASRACRICGQEGHLAAQCTGEKKFNLRSTTDEAAPQEPKKPVEKKPFIFLDVSILREYLEIELNVPQIPFPFNLEMALDDWIFLIFFVGNDFLPHLPSLEIREGAVDVLLKIWKDELPRMGGYLTNHGRVEMERAQIILQGLAIRENDIFRKRREGLHQLPYFNCCAPHLQVWAPPLPYHFSYVCACEPFPSSFPPLEHINLSRRIDCLCFFHS